MAKFKVEVELDWLDEGVNIDEAIKNEIISSIKSKITVDATEEVTSKLTAFIQESTTEVIDTFLGATLARKIEDMKIPYKDSRWSSEVQLIPIGEFVGRRYEEYLNRKVYDTDGKAPRYDSDRQLSINEFVINKYLEKELTTKVTALIQKARKDAEDTIVKTLEENLRNQLSVDIIKRLNIPSMLRNLQEKAELFEGDTKPESTKGR